MAGYTRVDTINNIADGNVINAADLDGEFDGIQAAFNSSTGHNHDGTAGEGAPILALGPVQDVTISTTVLGVKTTNTVDLGTTGLRFKDFYLAGNASVGGTLGVTGVATFSGAVALNGNTTIGDADTDTITQAASYVTGTQLKSAKTATNTLSLAAYDVDGTAYTDLITLTASNTPTLALTSTGVGTINNMSIGATTASTGAFTTLSATGDTTLGDASTDTVTVNGTTTFNASPIISVTDNTNAALRITQLGTGNALLVEDSSNPDSSPFVITASGDVGIGTSSPARRLQVSNTSGDSYIGIEASNANISGILFADPDDNNIGRLSYDHATDSLQSWTNNQERMTIDSSGNVGIGATSPAVSGLEIARATGSASPTPAELRISTTTNASDWSITNPWGRLSFYSADTSASGPKIHGAIDATATTTSGATSYMQFKVNVTGSNTLRKTQEFLGGASTTSTIFYAGAEAEAMRITSVGYVGIGTSSPAGRLTIKGESGASALQQLSFEYPLSTSKFLALGLEDATGNAQIMAGSGAALLFYTNSDLDSTNERMAITSAGNVGIGTSSPVGKLNVVGGTTGGTSFDTAVLVGGASGVAGSGAKLYLSGASTAPTARAAVIEGVSSGTANAHDMVFSTNAGGATPAERMRIDSTGAAIFTPAAGTGAVFNEGGVDADFRVESDTDSNAFFVRGSDGYVGIGTGSPTSLFFVNGESSLGNVVFKQNVSAYTTGYGNPVIARASGFTGVYNSGSLLLQARSDAAAEIAFITGTTPAERMRITSTGDVGIGTIAPTYRLHLDNISAGDGIAIQDSNDSNSVGLYFLNNSNVVVGSIFGLTDNTGMSFQTNGSERARIDSSGNVLVTSAASLGYGTGSGGTVTQATSKATGVTLNKPTGRITMNNAALAANTTVSFAVTNSLVATTDTVVCNLNFNSVNYQAWVYRLNAGSFEIAVRNISGGSLSEAVVLNFAIIKGATS
jgi:hypothetical protein